MQNPLLEFHIERKNNTRFKKTVPTDIGNLPKKRDYYHFYLNLIIIVLSLSATSSYAQKRGSRPRFISAEGHYSKFNVHTSKLKYFNNTYPYGAELCFGRTYLDKTTRENYHFFTRMGLTFIYWNFNHSALGYSTSSLFFIEPYLWYTARFKLTIKGAAGITYLSNPYDEQTNPMNQTFSTQFAFPLQIGMTGYYQLNKFWAIKLSANFHHISNGGIKQPNLGINHQSMALGIDRIINDYNIPTKPTLTPMKKKEKQKRLEAYVGVGIKDQNQSQKHKIVATTGATFSKQIGRINAVTTGATLEADGTIKDEMDNNPDTDNDSYYRAGVMVGHEFLLGPFSFGQHFGVYIYKPHKTNSPLFQQYTIQLPVYKSFFVGGVLKAHGRRAEYTGIRIGYNFIANNSF